MKTRVITAAVGLALLAVVLAFFDTILFDLVLSAVCLIAVHEVFSAMGFGRKQWYLYVLAVPFTLLVMLTTSPAARSLVLPVSFVVVLLFNVIQIAHVQTLDFGKLAGYVYFSGVIIFCFYSLIHLKRMLPFTEYRYDAVYFILLTLCFAWGGDTAAILPGVRSAGISWRRWSAPTKRWRGPWAVSRAAWLPDACLPRLTACCRRATRSSASRSAPNTIWS